MYVVMANDSIYDGLSLVADILGPVPQWDRYHHLLREINDLTSPVGRDLISDTSRLVAILSVVSSFGGSVMGVEIKVNQWFHVEFFA